MRFKHKFILIIVILVNLLLYIGIKQSSSGNLSVMTGKSVYNFELATLKDKVKLSKADLEGQKYLINVFASWCKSCRKEHEALMQIAKENVIPIYGVAFKDNQHNIEQFLAKHGNPYRLVAVDMDGNFAVNVGVKGFPETILIDEKGRILYVHTGIMTRKLYEDNIKPLIQTR